MRSDRKVSFLVYILAVQLQLKTKLFNAKT